MYTTLFTLTFLYPISFTFVSFLDSLILNSFPTHITLCSYDLLFMFTKMTTFTISLTKVTLNLFSPMPSYQLSFHTIYSYINLFPHMSHFILVFPSCLPMHDLYAHIFPHIQHFVSQLSLISCWVPGFPPVLMFLQSPFPSLNILFTTMSFFLVSLYAIFFIIIIFITT